ncbi:hypothetical protein DdX_20645 [Ditylenchus destructor]|uniref:Uncharacterized protein n=1 Tax=Ditylenchus destructor TaxID=166010 RepID=A0AAD4MIF1_9BILA|nr:hypothetical protein DdX_20645 [Ditylenchus destructor]
MSDSWELRDLKDSFELILLKFLPMSCSKPLPPFVCDSLYYLNRDQLERFTIVCLPLKNFIERYLHSKPYRVFDQLKFVEDRTVWSTMMCNGFPTETVTARSIF